MARIHLYMPDDNWKDDNVMWDEPEKFGAMGVVLERVFSPKDARQACKNIRPDDLLLISGHGSYAIPTQMTTDQCGKEAKEVIGVLADAGLAKSHEAVLSVACDAGGRSKKIGGQFTQASAHPNDYKRLHVSNVEIYNQDRLEPHLDPEKDSARLPLAGHMAREFGKLGYCCIRVGGFPGQLKYNYHDFNKKIGLPHGFSSTYDGKVYFAGISLDHGRSGRMFADLDHIQWYGPKGTHIKPDRIGGKFIPKRIDPSRIATIAKLLDERHKHRIKENKQLEAFLKERNRTNLQKLWNWMCKL